MRRLQTVLWLLVLSISPVASLTTQCGAHTPAPELPSNRLLHLTRVVVRLPWSSYLCLRLLYPQTTVDALAAAHLVFPACLLCRTRVGHEVTPLRLIFRLQVHITGFHRRKASPRKCVIHYAECLMIHGMEVGSIRIPRWNRFFRGQFQGSYLSCKSLILLSFLMASIDRCLAFSVSCRSCRHDACSGLHMRRSQHMILIVSDCLTRPALPTRIPPVSAYTSPVTDSVSE